MNRFIKKNVNWLVLFAKEYIPDPYCLGHNTFLGLTTHAGIVFGFPFPKCVRQNTDSCTYNHIVLNGPCDFWSAGSNQRSYFWSDQSACDQWNNLGRPLFLFIP